MEINYILKNKSFSNMEAVLFLTKRDIKYDEECQHFIGKGIQL